MPCGLRQASTTAQHLRCPVHYQHFEPNALREPAFCSALPSTSLMSHCSVVLYTGKCQKKKTQCKSVVQDSALAFTGGWGCLVVQALRPARRPSTDTCLVFSASYGSAMQGHLSMFQSLPAALEKHDLRKSRISISSSPHASCPVVKDAKHKQASCGLPSTPSRLACMHLTLCSHSTPNLLIQHLQRPNVKCHHTSSQPAPHPCTGRS